NLDGDMQVDGDLTIEGLYQLNGGDIRVSGTVNYIDSNFGGTGTITGGAINYAPDAVDEAFSTAEDTPLTTGNVLANDTDPDGDTLSMESFTQPTHGTVEYNGDGTFTYTPDAKYTGADSFTYTVSDGQGGTSTATVDLTVDAVNHSPTDILVDSVQDNQPLQVEGASEGVTVVGIYAPGSETNILDGKPELQTLSDHHYFEHGSLGYTGYNYMGSHHWFSDNGISISGLRGGTVVFSDGTTGEIDAVSNGAGDSENAYIYYRAYDQDVDATIDENASAGTTVATLSTTDPDANDSFSYSIAENDNFEIVGNELRVKDGAQLNHEENASHDIEVTVTDSAGDSYVETITVHVADVNEAPSDLSIIPDLDNPANLTDGAAAGTTVIGIYAPGSSTNLLDGAPELETLSDHHYFEHGSLGHTGYNFMGGHHWFSDNDISISGLQGGTVVFSDGTTGEINAVSNGAGDSESAYIYYRAYDPNADATVSEEAVPGTLVAGLNAKDADAGDSITYSIVGDSEQFEIVGNDILVKDGATLDYETAASHELTVRATDADGLSHDRTITIHVEDVDEAPIVLTEIEDIVLDGQALHFGGGDDTVLLSDLDLNTEPGSDVTVEFWMKWDGTNNTMPFGFDRYDLWMRDGNFGFNTGSGDLYGIDASGLEEGWHHVTAVFNNGNANQSRMFIDGVEQEMEQHRGTPNNGSARVDSEAHISGWGVSDGYKFSGELDELRIWNGTRSEADILSSMRGEFSSDDPNLVAAYDFSGAEATPGGVTDISGNGHDGTMIGMDESNVVESDINSQDLMVNEGEQVQLGISATDPEGESLSYEWVQTSGPTVELSDASSPNPTFTAPHGSSNMEITFEVHVSDGENSVSDTISVTVNAVNDGPEAADDAISTSEDTPVTTGNVLTNDTDLDGDTLSVDSFTQPEHGSVEYNGDGTFTYTPEANYNGADSFTYTVSDGQGGTDTATVDLTVEAVADTPTLDVEPVVLGEEGVPIGLRIESSLTDASENLSIRISGVPEGFVLSAGSNEGDGTWVLEPGDLEGLTLTSPLGHIGEFHLNVEVTASEANGHAAVTARSINVKVVAIPLPESESNDDGIDWSDDTDLHVLDPGPTGEGVDKLMNTVEQLLQTTVDVDGHAGLSLDVVDEIVGNGSHERFQLPELNSDTSAALKLEPLTYSNTHMPEDQDDHEVAEPQQLNGDESDVHAEIQRGGISTFLWGLMRGIAGTRETESRDDKLDAVKPGKRR
ncbi:MAG: tandem-95 repeat protein, partial [Pirellulales bacterium]|nr:tandem-95 repeat protein [Pirellulales bacterium]